MEQEPKFYVDRGGYVRAIIPSLEEKAKDRIEWVPLITWTLIVHGVLAFWGLVYYWVR